MCTYSISIDDTVLEKVRPAFPNDEDIEAWMQSQMDILLQQLAESLICQPNTKSISSRLHGIANAPKDFDYKQEQTSHEERSYSPVLETILAMPLLDKSDVGLNGEQVRMDYYKEKYAL